MNDPALVVSALTKEYSRGDNALAVLRGVDWTVNAGESVAIMGVSGSGKSTLLNLLAGFERATSGNIKWSAAGELAGLSERELRRFYREHVGFVFQRFNLLTDFSAWQNIVLGLKLAGADLDSAQQLAHSVAKQLQIVDLLDRRINTMSHGQAQRVAIARALAKNPSIILADEPTGSVDESNAGAVLDLMFGVRQSTAGCLIMVTHDANVAKRCDRVCVIEEGRLRPAN